MFGLLGYFIVSSVIQCFTFNQYDYPQKTEMFPFTRWAMFAGSTGNISELFIYEFQGTTSSGDQVYLNPAHLFLTPNATVQFTKTQSLGDQICFGASQQRAWATNALRAYMEGLKKRYDRMHPGTKLSEIALWRRKIPVKNGAQIPEPFQSSSSMVVFKLTSSDP